MVVGLPEPPRAQAHATASTSGSAASAIATAAGRAGGLPSTYRCLVARRTGRSFREVAEVAERPLELPGPNQVLVRIKYAGVNGGCETFRARGEYAFAANRGKAGGFPLGAEGSGVVAAVGEGVRGLSVGQAVACNGAAAFAEYGLAQAHMCTPVGAATPEAAALVLSGVCAGAALEGTARVAPGEVVLVTAAAGGTGHFAVQLAALAGARVVAVCGSAAKKAALESLGAAERVIDYREEDISAVLSSEYPSGVDVAYEGVGGALRAAVLRHLAPGGRLLQVGYISEYPHAREGAEGGAESSGGGGGGGSGAASCDAAAGGAAAPPAGAEDQRRQQQQDQQDQQDLPVAELFWGGKNVELPGGRRVIGQVWPKDVAAIRRARRRVFQLHERGELAAWTDLSHGFSGVEGVANAVDYMLRGGHVGKVVVPLL